MSMSTDTDPDTARTREEKLKALVRKDIDDEITTLAKDALANVQEGSS